MPLLTTKAIIQALREAAGSGATPPSDLLIQSADEIERLHRRTIPTRVERPPFQFREASDGE